VSFNNNFKWYTIRLCFHLPWIHLCDSKNNIIEIFKRATQFNMWWNLKKIISDISYSVFYFHENWLVVEESFQKLSILISSIYCSWISFGFLLSFFIMHYEFCIWAFPAAYVIYFCCRLLVPLFFSTLWSTFILIFTCWTNMNVLYSLFILYLIKIWKLLHLWPND